MKPALKPQNRIRLGDDRPDSIRLVSDRVDARLLGEGDNPTAVVNLSRVITFRDLFYGKIELTKKKFSDMIQNFESNVFGQRIYLDVAHRTSEGSAGVFKRLFLEGNKFRGEIEFTELGVDAVSELNSGKRISYVKAHYKKLRIVKLTS